MKIATKDAIERFKLVPKLSLFFRILVDVYFYSWLAFFSDGASKIKGVGIKNYKIVSAKKHRNVCQIVDCVKAKTKLSNFFIFLFFCATIKFNNVFKILIPKLSVVVNPQSRTLTFFHSFVNQTGHSIFVSSFIVKKSDLSGTSIVCVLN